MQAVDEERFFLDTLEEQTKRNNCNPTSNQEKNVDNDIMRINERPSDDGLKI